MTSQSLTIIEDWRPVPGLEVDWIEASSLGRVRVVAHAAMRTIGNRTFEVQRPERIVPTYEDGFGRVRVGIRIVGKVHQLGVARLVCAAFHGVAPSAQWMCAHIDGDLSRNVPANLRWSTPGENSNDKTAHGTMVQGEAHHLAKLTESDVRAIRAMKRSGSRSLDIAKAYRIHRSNVDMIVARTTWKHVT